MSVSSNNSSNLETQLLALQEEVAALRKQNTDLEERLKAHSLINTGQISLINKLIDKVPFGVMLLDENQIIIHANAAAGKILSVAVDKMQGQHCNNYFKNYDFKRMSSMLNPDAEINLKTIESVNNKKHIVHNAFISDEGSDVIIVETFIDVSEIKLAEQELLITNKAKDEFLGMISHELRTPLNVIQGYSSLLEDELRDTDNSDVSMYVENIHRAGEMLLQVVNNLLELSDLTAGKVRVDNIPIDLPMVVSQLQYRLEKDFAASRNKLTFKQDDIEPFEQDLALLMKVLYELLMNANKFTEAGEVTLYISLQKKDGSNWLCFKITDTGCGMTEETIEQIFKAFHQADSALNRSYEGLGLGLSLVEKIVNIINGYIEVESELGVGTAFSIFLPYHPLKNV